MVLTVNHVTRAGIIFIIKKWFFDFLLEEGMSHEWDL